MFINVQILLFAVTSVVVRRHLQISLVIIERHEGGRTVDGKCCLRKVRALEVRRKRGRIPASILGVWGSVEGSGILNPNPNSPTHSQSSRGLWMDICRVVICFPSWLYKGLLGYYRCSYKEPQGILGFGVSVSVSVYEAMGNGRIMLLRGCSKSTSSTMHKPPESLSSKTEF